jgi:hypothetical protein
MVSTVANSLKKSLDDFKSALDWLNHSYELCQKTGIKDDYSVEELDAFENLTSRYARITDFLIHKLFRSIDAVEFLETVLNTAGFTVLYWQTRLAQAVGICRVSFNEYSGWFQFTFTGWRYYSKNDLLSVRCVKD